MGQSYSDIEIQNIAYGVGVDDTDDTGQVEYATEIEPLDSTGIDNDELAELVGFRRTATLHLDQVDGAGSYGGAAFEGAMGIDLGDNSFDGFIPNLTGDGQGFDTVSNPDGLDPRNNFYTDDDPAQLDSFFLSGHGSFSDDSTGTGGAGSSMIDTRTLIYTDFLDNGPVLDRADDLSVGAEVFVQNNEVQVIGEVYMQLWWDVHHVQGQRQQFAPP